MRMLLLTAAAAVALAAASMAAQAQERGRSEQAPPQAPPLSGTVEPRAVKTESIRRTEQPAQSTGQASTDQTMQQPSAARPASRAQRQRTAKRHSARAAQVRTSRTRKPTTTGQAAGRVSAVDLPRRSRAPYAQATYVERSAARPGDRIVLTEPQVTSLNAAFTDYIGRMNVWSRAPWEVPATVGGTVPSWVQVYGVPAEIVAIYPEFAGDQFVVVGDDIVVIEPVTRRIVAMISRTSNTAVLDMPPSTTGVAPPVEERVRLTRPQIAAIRTVLRDRSCRYERPADFFVGGLMPATAPVCAFPERVVSAVPDIADFRYITRRNTVVVVDPANDRVVSVLR